MPHVALAGPVVGSPRALTTPRGTARGRRATSQRCRLSVARSDCRFQRFLDGAVFGGPEPAKPLKSRGVHFLVADASEPVATPVTRKIMLVAHWGVPAES